MGVLRLYSSMSNPRKKELALNGFMRLPSSSCVRVFHFILDHRVGGPHVYVRGLASVLAPEITSTLVTSGRGAATDWALTNLRHRFKPLYPLEVVINVMRLCWCFRRRAVRRGVIFDVHGAANLAPVLAARLLGIPLAWHFHETLANFAALVRLGKKAANGVAHRYIVVAALAKKVFSLPEATLIPGAVDPEFWQVAMTPKAAVGGPLRLLVVGNLNPLKGMDVLLASLGELKPPWELIIVGSELQTFSAFANGLRDQAARLVRPGCRVEFAGWQSPEAVRDLLAHTDVFVLPSRSEACPIALLEAMAAGCACVATNVGDVAVVLAVPGSGIVVPSESPAALTAALVQAGVLGVAGRQEMGRRARERVLADYSLRQMAARHLEIYKQLVQEV